MTVLAIDSSSRHRLLCVVIDDVRGGGSMLASELIAEGTVSDTLLPAMARMLRPDISSVVVVIGPGSFTGLRAGMAAALGVAHARDLPLYGVGALTVVAAAPSAPRRVRAVTDAGRGYLYTALVERTDGGFRVDAGPERLHRDGWRLDGEPAVTLDDLACEGATRDPDPLRALATAAAVAVAGTPLPRAGLAPTYVDDLTAPGGRVS